MNVGYTPERAQALASRLRTLASELEAAVVVVECSRRTAAEHGAGQRSQLLAALDEYDRRQAISSSVPPAP